MSALRLHWGKVGVFGLLSIAGCNAVLGIEDYDARPQGSAGSGGDSVGGGAGTSSSGGEAGDSSPAGMGGDIASGGSGGSEGGSAGKGGSVGKGGSAGSDGGSGGSIDACSSGPLRPWANWPMPNPPSLPSVPNPQSYTPETIGADVIVHDDVTGLVWLQDPAPAPATWEDAKIHCEDLTSAGFCDWRLPSRIELASILDYTQAPPFIDPDAFPDTPIAIFWSASPVADLASNAWAVWFSTYFQVAAQDVTSLNRVRCVRGAADVAQNHYTVGSAGLAGTVLDNETHLRWQAETGYVTGYLQDFESFCQNATTGGITDWRLPSIGELLTLVDEGQSNPSIDETVFPGTIPYEYSTSLGVPYWYDVLFAYGSIGTINTDGSYEFAVRCVH
jgi:Protein of unknown function (DUF1566)